MLKLVRKGGKLEGHELHQSQFGNCGENTCLLCGAHNQSTYDTDYGIWFWKPGPLLPV
jgi:hypothetical protein